MPTKRERDDERRRYAYEFNGAFPNLASFIGTEISDEEIDRRIESKREQQKHIDSIRNDP